MPQVDEHGEGIVDAEGNPVFEMYEIEFDTQEWTEIFEEHKEEILAEARKTGMDWIYLFNRDFPGFEEIDSQFIKTMQVEIDGEIRSIHSLSVSLKDPLLMHMPHL